MEKEYTIIKKLREDKLGKVFLIEKNNELYALKQIKLELKEEDLEQFKNIINSLSKINNENIIKYHDIFIKDDTLNILMEYSEDCDLKQFVQNYRNKLEFIDENIIRNIIMQICNVLKVIHENNIIHGDLKIDNIFIDKNNKIKIGNFIMSKILTKLNQDKKIEIIKAQYFAPEIEEGLEYNNKVDIYSLGCIMYELFTLNEYRREKIIDKNDIKINIDLYNSKYQELIDLLLKKEYHERPNTEEVINKIKLIPVKIEQKEKKNYILAEIKIDEKDINKDIRIINSFEECNRKTSISSITKKYKEHKNEKEIKKNCKIKINNNNICFNYFFNFKEKGKYIIEYIFTNNITKTDFMFSGCNLLTKINLSNFNAENVIDMSGMFYGCISLTNINLSNFNTQNVNDMSWMFYACTSLSNLNLSNLNTRNVTDMSWMFNRCTSLSNLNLSNFNTQNVTNMAYMFNECTSLSNLNLSNFNTKNVTNMAHMFDGCESLKDLDLSSFNTEMVTDMTGIFYECISLSSLNISNFNTKEVKDISLVFEGCESLNKKNIITKDKNILDEFEFTFGKL